MHEAVTSIATTSPTGITSGSRWRIAKISVTGNAHTDSRATNRFCPKKSVSAAPNAAHPFAQPGLRYQAFRVSAIGGPRHEKQKKAVTFFEKKVTKKTLIPSGF